MCLTQNPDIIEKKIVAGFERNVIDLVELYISRLDI